MTALAPDGVTARLLIVDDDPVVLRSMKRTLERSGYEVHVAECGQDALDTLGRQDVDVALIDLALPDLPGLEVMRRVKAKDPTVECVIFTGYSSAPVAVDAYESGAVEYFEKPITDWSRFDNVLRRAVRLRRMAAQRAASPLARAERRADPGDLMILLRRELTGSSKAVEDLRRLLLAQVGRDTPVVLTGPPGAGKSRVAEVLHQLHGDRADRGRLEFFQAERGQTTPEQDLYGHQEPDGRWFPGAFERAGQGTVVLEEPGQLSFAAQRRMLEILDRGELTLPGRGIVPILARVVFTFREEIEAQVQAGRLLEGLARRLTVRIRVPGMDERAVDIPPLVYSFLRTVNQEAGLDVRRVPGDVMQVLAGANWTRDHVRGLRSAVEAAALGSRGDALEVEALPAELRAARSPRGAPAGSVRALEMPIWNAPRLPDRYRGLSYAEFKDRLLNDFMLLYLRDVIESCDGNITHAARLAGLHRPNFRRLMKRYQIEGGDDEDG